MNWYYVEQGQQAGPVDDVRLADLRQSGRILDDTLVWREGMANWAPYASAVGQSAPVAAAPPLIAPGPGEAICTECGGVFPEDQMIRYANARVCANCKPVFMQKIAEGVAVGQGAPGSLTEQQILQREYRVEIGDALSRAWNLFTANAGHIIGTMIVVGLVLIGCGMVAGLVGLVIPFGNGFLSVLYQPALTAGMLWFFLRLMRGESAALADVFAGFSRCYGQLVLFGLIQFLLYFICLLPVFVAAVLFAIAGEFRPGTPPSEFAFGLIAGFGVTGLIALCAITYVNVVLVFALLLIIDKRYRFWPAMQLSRRMVSQRWWMTFLFLFVAVVLWFCGALFCLVGLLVTGPLYLGMKTALYNDNFGDLAEQA